MEYFEAYAKFNVNVEAFLRMAKKIKERLEDDADRLD